MKPTLSELVRDYIRLVYFFAKRWIDTQQDLEDAVQDIFMKVFREYASFRFRTVNELKSWLLQVSRSVVMDRYRKQKPSVPFNEHLETTIESTHTADTWLEEEIKKEQLARVYKYLDVLPMQDREIIQLRIVEELSFAEIGVIFLVSEAAAKMRYYRVITHLRKQLI